MDNKEYASAYAIAKICGYSGSFDDFKKLYNQYYSDIIESLPEEKTEPARAEAAINPMSSKRFIF
ncbi:hypothetical protein [Eubacterium ramulus]